MTCSHLSSASCAGHPAPSCFVYSRGSWVNIKAIPQRRTSVGLWKRVEKFCRLLAGLHRCPNIETLRT